MSETFEYSFGGWHEAEARRWKNPDGSVGGVVALSANVHPDIVLPFGAVVWPNAKIEKAVSIGDHASIGNGASIGDGAAIGKNDWLFIAGPQGSRNALVTAVWSAEHGLRWWVGCQSGISTEEFVARVKKDHGGTDHEADYLYLIGGVEGHPGLARHKQKICHERPQGKGE
jgi:hypothetical protein